MPKFYVAYRTKTLLEQFETNNRQSYHLLSLIWSLRIVLSTLLHGGSLGPNCFVPNEARCDYRAVGVPSALGLTARWLNTCFAIIYHSAIPICLTISINDAVFVFILAKSLFKYAIKCLFAAAGLCMVGYYNVVRFRFGNLDDVSLI